MGTQRAKITGFTRALVELNNRASGRLLIVFALGLIATSLLGNLIYDLLTFGIELFSRATLWTVGGVCVLVVLAYLLWELHIRNMHVVTLVKDSTTIEPHAGLIWIMSPNKTDAPLLAIQHHGTKLKHIWVILVEGDESTKATFDLLKDQIENEHSALPIEPFYITGQDVEASFAGIEQIYQHHVPAAHLNPQDVVADITGGLKTMTAGVALACAMHSFPMEYLASERDPYGNVRSGTQRPIHLNIDFQQN